MAHGPPVFLMRFIVDKWSRIGTRLYLALGFAVALTLVSGAVGVYYFEQSGNYNYQVRSESVPALEASWAAAREAERLRGLGQTLFAANTTWQSAEANAVDRSLDRLEAALSEANTVPELMPLTEAVSDAAYDLVEVIDNVERNWDGLRNANANAAEYRSRLAISISDVGKSEEALAVLRQALQARDEATLDGLWEQFEALHAQGIDQRVTDLGEGEGVFYVSRQQLALEAGISGLAASFDTASAVLTDEVSNLTTAADQYSAESLELAVSSFDEGRTLLTAISVISVLVATLAAWLWVGNGMVRRLSRMSERMRGMAGGDLETPVPEVGRDEIGELAGALETFRKQALEVQRLNLVEQLYEELRQTNAELQRTQDRLVAQQKLAALGQLVSGVAHEISNPLNFVHNFSEGSLELYTELSEMLDTYKDKMSEADTELLDDISQELTDSLNRVLTNGGRALAIVERMRGLGVVGGDLTMVNLNEMLWTAVRSGCNIFTAEWQDFSVQPTFDLDQAIGEVSLVEKDFGEAILNLVSNACFAMRQKREGGEENYQPDLVVSTRLVDGNVEIRIRDNGTGIPDDVVGNIFNPFFSTREGASGSGLGLSIAADVVRRSGGELSVDTVHGEYAEFILTLPQTAASEHLPEAAETT